MNIIIPMAGMGKRMRPHTLTTAKPLLPIAGKPIVQRLVEDILSTSNQKVEEIAFIIAPTFGKEVEQHLINVATTLGAKGRICYQTEALGTAHAILCAKELLKGKRDESSRQNFEGRAPQYQTARKRAGISRIVQVEGTLVRRRIRQRPDPSTV
jgi:NDP-sugar pyrophosphorylase family protein